MKPQQSNAAGELPSDPWTRSPDGLKPGLLIVGQGLTGGLDRPFLWLGPFAVRAIHL